MGAFLLCQEEEGDAEKKLLALVSALCLPACPIRFLKAINSGRFSKEHVNDAAAASSSILQLHNTKNTQASFQDNLTECTSFHMRTFALHFGAQAGRQAQALCPLFCACCTHFKTLWALPV